MLYIPIICAFAFQVVSELGFSGMWGGLGTRIIMIGTLTGLQWWIYDVSYSLFIYLFSLSLRLSWVVTLLFYITYTSAVRLQSFKAVMGMGTSGGGGQKK